MAIDLDALMAQRQEATGVEATGFRSPSKVTPLRLKTLFSSPMRN